MDKSIIEIEIIQPGRTTGQYQFTEHGFLRLIQVLYPEVVLPFDIGILPNTMTSEGDPLKVVLLGETSHPLHTQVTARLLGGIQTNGTDPYLLAVSNMDERFKSITSVMDLSNPWRNEVDQQLKTSSATELSWLKTNDLEPWIKQARRKYRLSRVKNNNNGFSQPAWKPVDTHKPNTSYTEREHYTSGEYTFFQLPYHIQYYVSEYLDEDERILYAVRRPAMSSHLIHSWLGREKLQEGVLILTTQRLIQLVELVPLGNSGVRYGFRAQLGMLERLVDVTAETLSDEVVLLKSKWQSKDGCGFLEWESPLYTRTDIYELISILEKFTPAKINPQTLQRITLPNPSELPSLRDPACNDPIDEKIINRHFADAIPALLLPSEKIFAWALWPAWFENKGVAQVMVVTGSRLFIVADPDLQQPLILDIPLSRIVTMEYTGSILNSYIELSLVESGKVQRITLKFPYSADGAFHRCFEVIRRCMAVIPLIS